MKRMFRFDRADTRLFTDDCWKESIDERREGADPLAEDAALGGTSGDG